MHTTTPSGRPRRITPDDVRDAITRRLTAHGVSADHLARVLAVAPAMPEPERPRYTLKRRAAEGTGYEWTTWRVLDADGEESASLHLTTGYIRADDGRRIDYVLFLTLNLPRPAGQAWSPYAHLLVVPAGAGPESAEPLKAHMQLDEPPADDDGPAAAAAMERARVLLADIWLSGALTDLWHRFMEK